MAVGNLIRATPKKIQRFVLTTSAGFATAQHHFQQPCACLPACLCQLLPCCVGVERFNQLPFSILNLFGKQHHLLLPPCS